MPDQTELDRLVAEQFADVLDKMIVRPPSAEPITWAGIQAAMDKVMAVDVPPSRELHCGYAVWDTLRELKPDDTGPLGLGAALGGQPLYGVPVHVDHGMKQGRWELREGEDVVQSGDITPDFDGHVIYLGGGRWGGLRMRGLPDVDDNARPEGAS